MPTIEFHKESNVSAVKMNVAIICVEVPWGTADFSFQQVLSNVGHHT